MIQKVTFTAMIDGTAEDYALLNTYHAGDAAQSADRVLDLMRSMDDDSPYQISRLDHCLQTATRAENDGADDETIVCALLHDIGDVIAPANHSAIAAAMLMPFVSGKNYWIVKHHGLFQGYYYFEHHGMDPNERDHYRGHEYYDACVEFCARWDQPSFDPDYETRCLEHFEPLVRELFARTPRPFF